MSSRIPLAAVPSDTASRTEPSLTAGEALAAPRLGSRARPKGPFELRAGERAIVASSEQAAERSREGWPLAAKIAFAVMSLLALFGAVMLVRLFVVV